MNILLDTHILLWTITGDSKLPEKAVSLIEDIENNTVFNPVSLQ